LLDDLARYLPAPDVESVRRAYAFAAEAHAGQLRESGEPYINHPLAVAETLASIRMDTATIVAALCHDVSEDCGVPMSELESRFGREVARLVDGVTKLDKMQFLHVDGDTEGRPRVQPSGQDLWAENMRKMFLAMAEDIRVVLI
jgi:GTP pyrophosphokinase